jgi:cellulose synthase/poly-beta-1,6-N-acetylglucosamine synthase-like glycosyltransferase
VLEADPLLWLAVATAAFWILDGLYLARGMRSIASLGEVEPAPDGACPPASICVPARNEAADVEEAVRSMLALDYPALEVIVVDDRSTDETGDILDRMAGERGRSRLAVIHVEELPAGWVGKNHALHRAAEAATGELLLFTDADVRMSPDLLRRAANRMRQEGLDHLTAIPRMEWPGSFMRALGALMSLGISQFTEPWKLGDPSSPKHVGVGAFNLVRVDAYREAGGHGAIPRRPDDDLALAGILKESGARAEFLSGRGFIRVRWYRSVGELMRGVGRSERAALG